MAGNKYLKLDTSGFPIQQAANQTSAGAGDAGAIVALNSAGEIDSTMLPSGLGSASQTMTAGEALSAGNFVYIDSADSGKVKKADANSIAKKAVGYVLTSISNGATGTVYFEGTNSGLSGLTIGVDYFLSATAGGVVEAATATAGSAGDIVQYLGTAITTSAIPFKFSPPIVLA